LAADSELGKLLIALDHVERLRVATEAMARWLDFVRRAALPLDIVVG
jgi:hypothetical protein